MGGSAALESDDLLRCHQVPPAQTATQKNPRRSPRQTPANPREQTPDVDASYHISASPARATSAVGKRVTAQQTAGLICFGGPGV